MFTLKAQNAQAEEATPPEPTSPSASFLTNEDNNIDDIFKEISSLEGENLINALDSVTKTNFSIKWLINNDNFPDSLENFERMVLNLPITSYIGMGLLNNAHRFDLFHSTCHDCGRHFKNITEFRDHIATHGREITNDEYYEHINCENTLRLASGLIIEQCSSANNNGVLFQFACTHPDCGKCFQNVEEYAKHRENEHIDDLSDLNFYFADVIRWLRKSNRNSRQVPLVKDFYKNVFTGHIEVTTPDGNMKGFSYYNQSIYQSSVDFIIEHDITANFSSIVNHNLFWVIENSYFDHEVTTTFGDYPELRIEKERQQVDFNMLCQLDVPIRDETETSIEAEETDDSDSLGNVSRENLGSFITHVIGELKKLKEPEELLDIIDLLTQVEVDNDVKEVITSEDATFPALLYIAFKYKWLPKPGIGSPFIGNNETFASLNHLQNHIRKEIGTWSNNEAIGHETVYYFPITGEGRWRVKYQDTDNIMWDQNIRTCQYFNCEYASLSTKFSSHTIQGKHKHDCSKYDKYGPFWGPHIKLAIEEDRMIECGYFKSERNIYKCSYPNCPACFGRVDELYSHYASRAHKDKIKRTFFNCTRVWVSKEEEIAHNHEAEQSRNRENARAIIENPNNNETPSTSNETNTTNQQEAVQVPNAELNSQTNENEAQNNQVQEQANQNDDEQEALIAPEPSNDQLIAQARDWISHFSAVEENSIGIPTLTPARRKLVKKDLNALYDHTIIPLLNKYMPHDDSENERTKLDGVIYKISDEFREHCRRALHLTKENMYRNPSSSQAVNNNIRNKINDKMKEEKEAIAAASMSRDSVECLKALIEVREIMKRETIDLAATNRINKLKKAIRTIINIRDEEWCTNVFGGKNDNCIDSTLNLQDDVFERRCEWLRARIDETAPQVTSMQEKIRELFTDNPRKCLDRYVWPKTTPECTLSPDQFAQHYGNEWSSTTEQYSNPLNDEQWNIDVTIRDGVEDRFQEYTGNTKKIEEIIRSRNYVSAHGRDEYQMRSSD